MAAKSHVVPLGDTVKLVFVSDTHGKHEELVLPRGDILVYCGDFESDAFAAWLVGEAAHYTHGAIVVAGNMDAECVARVRATALSADNDVYYLEHEALMLGGLRFFGSPYTPEYVGAWQIATADDGKALWSAIPADTDVLVTHGPPYKVLDRTSGGVSVGDRELRDAVWTRVRPRVHAFGHVHASTGIHVSREIGTIFVNAAQWYPRAVPRVVSLLVH